ncbi:hypothetical protein MRX96_001035 [Rhipicephalus microplus]
MRFFISSITALKLAVKITKGAINSTLIYRRGLKVVYYGRFRFSAAFRLAKVFDGQGLHWHAYGHLASSLITTESSHAVLEHRYSCLAKASVEKFHI